MKPTHKRIGCQTSTEFCTVQIEMKSPNNVASIEQLNELLLVDVVYIKSI